MKRKVVLKVIRIIRDIVVNISNDEAFMVMNDITQQLCIFNDLAYHKFPGFLRSCRRHTHIRMSFHGPFAWLIYNVPENRL